MKKQICEMTDRELRQFEIDMRSFASLKEKQLLSLQQQLITARQDLYSTNELIQQIMTELSGRYEGRHEQ